MEINQAAQEVIDKISHIAEHYGDIWDEKKVIEAMTEYYAELGVPMPQVIIQEDLVIGYTAARDAAWDAARDAARDAAWDAARGAARDAARGAARGAARDAARDAAWDAARDAAWDAAWDAARGAAWDAARDAAWGAARGAAWGAAWDAARGAARGATYLNTGLNDSATLKMIAIESKILKALEFGLMTFFPMQDKLILVPMPKLRMNERTQLHSEANPAVEWKNGTKFYFLNGVMFEEKLWKEIVSKEISSKKALAIKSSDQRAIALQFIGGEKLMKDFDGKVIATDEYGELIELPKLLDTNNVPYKYLKAWNPESESFVYLRTWPEVKTPAEAETRSYRLERFGQKYSPTSRT